VKSGLHALSNHRRHGEKSINLHGAFNFCVFISADVIKLLENPRGTMEGNMKNLTPMEQVTNRMFAFHANLAACMDCAAFLRAAKEAESDNLQSMLLEAAWASFHQETAEIWH